MSVYLSARNQAVLVKLEFILAWVLALLADTLRATRPPGSKQRMMGVVKASAKRIAAALVKKLSLMVFSKPRMIQVMMAAVNQRERTSLSKREVWRDPWVRCSSVSLRAFMKAGRPPLQAATKKPAIVGEDSDICQMQTPRMATRPTVRVMVKVSSLTWCIMVVSRLTQMTSVGSGASETERMFSLRKRWCSGMLVAVLRMAGIVPTVISFKQLRWAASVSKTTKTFTQEYVFVRSSVISSSILVIFLRMAETWLESPTPMSFFLKPPSCSKADSFSVGSNMEARSSSVAVSKAIMRPMRRRSASFWMRTPLSIATVT
mmetsp:Transcript_20778/g.38829  ORF Transcript_20778/g.38829 Transcript_20778/m.38829 type:complete len:318 (+) Transcript_20778:957-1910(+)